MAINQCQLEFESQPPARKGGKTQNEKLRDHFLARPNEWIPMPELAQVITPTGIGAAVHSRVDDCRSMYGMAIVNRRERQDGVCVSCYKYESTNAQN